MKKKVYYLLLIIVINCNWIDVYSQASSADPLLTGTVAAQNTPSTGPGDYLGWAGGVVIPLDIRHMGTLGIDFYIGGLAPANKSMTIRGTGSGFGGYVGISPNFVTGWNATHLLDVHNLNPFFGGEVNVSGSNFAYNDPSGYSIGGNKVLWNYASVSDIFVGVGAGNLASTGSSTNTAVGYFAGSSFMTCGNNTVVGAYAGPAIDYGDNNTIMGESAGNSLTGSINNTFIGTDAGAAQGDGTHNNENTFVGFQAGENTNSTTTYEGGNSFFGAGAGIGNVTGLLNTMLGHLTDVGNSNLKNVTAIGAEAVVNNDDQMILGGDFSFGTPTLHHSTYVGIGLSGTLNGGAGPQNSLEINNGTDGPVVGVTRAPISGSGFYTATGLRFTQVKNDNINNNVFGQLFDKKTIQPWGKVLTVDENGDVGLTDDAGGGGLPPVRNALNYDNPSAPAYLEWGSGTMVGAYTPLLHNTEVQLADLATPNVGYNVYYSGNQSDMSNGNSMDVGIGYLPTVPLLAKLDVWNTTQVNNFAPYNNQYAGRFLEDGTYTLNGGAAINFAGVYGSSTVVPLGNKANNFGGDFLGTNAGNFNYGARGSSIPTGVLNVGLYGITDIKTYPPPFGSVNIGVYGDLGVGPCPGFPPVPCPTGPNFAGYFNGDVLSTTNFFQTSDENLKTNIQDISNGLDVINALQPKSYNFNQAANPSMNLPSNGVQYGLLAQDVQNVLPTAVKDCIHPARFDTLGNQIYDIVNFKAISYNQIIPFLIAGMKQQQSQIADLQAQLNSRRATPSQGDSSSQNQEQNQSTPNSAIDVTLSSKSIVLDQNQPNPFKEQTTITYFIPDDAKNVNIMFTDARGNVMKQVSIPEKGYGQINVFAQDLSSGVYTYTLVADGVTIDSKKMVCNK